MDSSPKRCSPTTSGSKTNKLVSAQHPETWTTETTPTREEIARAREATPKSMPLDGFGDADLRQPKKRRSSVQKTKTTVLEMPSSGAKKPATFDVKVDITPKLKGHDNKITPI